MYRVFAKLSLVLLSLSFIIRATTITSMSFQNAKLSDVIKAIAKIDHKSIMFGPNFHDKEITINVSKPINSDVLFNNILREYCLNSNVLNGITIINSGKCVESIQALPSISSLLKGGTSSPNLNEATLEKTETIILRNISTDQAKALLSNIKDIYNIYEAKKINVLVASGSPKAIKEVNNKLKPYFMATPRPDVAMLSVPLYIYNIKVGNFEKLVSHYLSKDAVIIHEEDNKIILEDYPKNIEDILEYFPEYAYLKPKYVTEVLFIKNNLDNVYKDAKEKCKLNVIKSEEFKAIILKGSPKESIICEKILSPFVSNIPQKNVVKSQTFYVKYITLDKFQKLIKPYLSEKAIVTPIKNMDAVTIIDYLQNLETIKKHFKEYVCAKPIYVQIDIKAIEINKQYQKQLGLGINFSYQNLYGVTNVNAPTSISASSGGINISGIYSYNKFRAIGFQIAALESIDKARSVFKSTLLAMNGQPTTLTQGIEYPFTTISTPGQAVPTVTLQNVLNSIKVTPQVLPNGKILLNINMQNMSLGPLAANGQPTINQNSSSLSIVLSNDSTLAIGGVGLENKNNTLQGIPGVDKIPIVGNIGASKSETSNNTELFIFITAKKVKR